MALNRTQKIRIGLIYPISLVVIALSFFIYPFVVRWGVYLTLYLGPSWPAYKYWTDIPVDIPLQISVFNITNHKEFLHKGCKPIFEEVGPYYFTYRLRKVDVVWDEVEETVKFHYNRNFTFHPDKSFGNENDILILPNLSLLSAYIVGPSLGSKIVTFGTHVLSYLYEHEIFVKRTAREFLYTGYFDIFADLGEPVLQTGILHGGKVGIIPLINGTDPIQISLSANRNSAGTLVGWDNKKSFGFFSSPECDKVRGLDLGLFPMPITKTSKYEIYSGEARQVFPIEYHEDVNVNGIIDAYSFTVPWSFFSSPRIYPPNRCRCIHADGCPDSGVIDLAPSLWGVPAVITHNYFNRTEKHIYQKVIFKNKKNHPKHIHIEIDPSIGAPVGGTLSAQISLRLYGIRRMGGFSKIPNMMYPLAIVDEIVNLDDEMTQAYWLLMKLPPILGYVFGSLSLVGLAYLTYRIFRYNACAGKKKPVIPRDLERQYAAEKAYNI